MLSLCRGFPQRLTPTLRFIVQDCPFELANVYDYIEAIVYIRNDTYYII